MRRRRHDLLVLGLVSTFPVAVLGQTTPCEGVAGVWTDSYGYQWTLQQQPDGYGGVTISGKVISDCNSEQFDVSGGMDFTGSMTVIANYPGGGPDSCGIYSFQYSGFENTIYGPGCEHGSGNWNNSAGDAWVWTWSKPCDAPNTEASSLSQIAWSDAITAYTWNANVISYSGLAFGGRPAAEGPSGDYPNDTCYDQFPYNGVVPRVPGVPNGPPFDLDWNESYTDTVGWTPTAIGVYRAAKPSILPCRFQMYQVMSIQCSSGASIPWKTNLLEGVIGDVWIQSGRDGNYQQRPF